MARFHGVLAGIVFALAVGVSAQAQEGPQRLALIANTLPVPLSCAGGLCAADLPAMCLEPRRPTPEKGQAYVPAVNAEITVSGRDGDGRRITRTLPGEAEFSALRSHVAVRLRLDETWLRRHFAKVEGLLVSDNALLRPVGGVARAATPPRKLAAGIVAGDRQRAVAVAVSTYILNTPPGRAEPAAVKRLWRKAVASLPASAEGLELARFQLDFCLFGAEARNDDSFRQCLQAQRDRAMEAFFERYDAALKSGS